MVDCPNGCSERGACANGTCVCQPGFHGEDCSEVACPDHCSHHGVCTDGSCLCYVGWVGRACALRACLNDCSERGTCINGTCDCVPPWSGADCASQPCPNNCSGVGVCRKDEAKGTDECYCPTGRTGDDCGTHVFAQMWARHGAIEQNLRGRASALALGAMLPQVEARHATLLQLEAHTAEAEAEAGWELGHGPYRGVQEEGRLAVGAPSPPSVDG